MEREEFLEKVRHRRDEGKTIRAIAGELGVHRSSVHRALKALEASSLQRPTSPARQPGSTFVGRQHEMQTLRAALEDLLAGQGGIFMVAGEPGIGKTRTAQELAGYAEQQGAQVLWGRCYEDEGAPAYWPWAQVVKSYLQAHQAARLRAEMGPRAADIAQIVPEIKEVMPDLQPPPALAPEAARFRLFDSMTTFLKNVARSQPLVLALEDLQWADRPSLRLLEFLAHEAAGMRLLVLGTYRDVDVAQAHPLSVTLGELVRGQSFRQIYLRGLTQEEAGRLIQLASVLTPHPTLVQAIYRHTEGNPLFLTEMVRLLAEEGMLAEGSEAGIARWRLRVPEGVRAVIGRRLHQLSQPCYQAMTLASLLGRAFQLEQLHPLVDTTSRESLIELLEEALAAWVIEEVAGEAGYYQFTHTLIQNTLVAELSATRRSQLHARIGETLEAQYGPKAEGHAVELAYHFAQAAPLLGPQKLVRYSLLAGEAALTTYAYEEALAHFQRALAAKEQQPMDGETAALLFGLGRSQAAMFQRQDAVTSLRRAFDYYVEVGDTAGAVAVAEYPITPGIGRVRVTQLIGRALELVPPESHAAGRLLSRYGLSLSNEMGDYPGAQAALERALDITEREQDMALEMETLLNVAIVEGFHLRWREAAEKSLKAVELAQVTADIHCEVRSRFYAAFALLSMGHCEEVSIQASAMLAQADRLRDRAWLANALWVNQTVNSARGNWQAARSFNDRGLEVAPREALLLGSRALLEYELGDFAQGQDYLERLLEIMRLSSRRATFEYAVPAIVVPLVARITGVVNWSDAAEAAANTVLSLPSAVPLIAVTARAGLALLEVQRTPLSSPHTPREGAGWVGEDYAGLAAARGTVVLCGMVSVDRLLGLMAQAVGQRQQTTTCFEDALALCRRAGYLPEYAWTCYDYANALTRSSGPTTHQSRGDREKAMALLDEALTIARELGMHPLAERVVALQDKAGPRPAGPPPVYPDGLTLREVEVLRLIATGQSNLEIAAEMHISINTVRRHLTNIFSKIGAANRAEAAVYAASRGLLGS